MALEDMVKKPGGSRSVKTEILMYVLPIVIVGLLIMAGVTFRYVGTTFEEQITRDTTQVVSEMSDSINNWLDKRRLETRLAADNFGARNMCRNAQPEHRVSLQAHGEDLSGRLRQRELGPVRRLGQSLRLDLERLQGDAQSG